MTQHYTDPFGPPWKCPWLKMLLHWEGSTFQFLWMEFVVAIALYALILGMWYLRLKDPNSNNLTPETEALFQTLGYVTSRFQAAISLMLGFYTSTIYNRWWKVRDVEGVVIGRINDLAVQIAALVREHPMGNDGKEEKEKGEDMSTRASESCMPSEKQSSIRNDANHNVKNSIKSMENTDGAATASQVRMNLVRWLNLAHALAVGDLYEKQPNEFSSLEHLFDFGLLTPQEYEYMKKNTTCRYQVPFIWFLNLVHELKDKGYCGITDATLIIFCGNVTRIRGSLADLYMYRNVPVPLSYRQLVNWTVRAYMVIFAVAGALGSMLTDDGNLGGLTPSVFFLLLPFSFEYFMFVGWLSLADALGNPFREWADEFEYENYVQSVALGSNQCITKSRDACTPLGEIHDITPTLEQKTKKTLAHWSQPSTKDYESLQRKLTGF